MKRLAIIGAGALGRIIAHYAELDNYEIVGFFDNFLACGKERFGYRILGNENDVLSLFGEGHFDYLLVGVGYNHMDYRHEVFQRFSSSIPFPTLVHPSVYADPTAKISAGTIILPGCTLDMYSKIGNNCFIYTDSHICHDTTIGDGCFVASGVHISGQSKIGDCSFIGIGATIKDYVTLQNHSKIGAGAVVVNDVEHTEIFYVGNPAKPLPAKCEHNNG